MSNKRLKTITFPGLDDVYTIPDEAPEYSASATYKVGDFVVYGGALYKCNTAIESAEDWTAAHWTVTKMGNEVSGLQTAITQNIPYSGLNFAQANGNIFDIQNRDGWQQLPTAKRYFWKDFYYPVATDTTMYCAFAYSTELYNLLMSTWTDTFNTTVYIYCLDASKNNVDSTSRFYSLSASINSTTSKAITIPSGTTYIRIQFNSNNESKRPYDLETMLDHWQDIWGYFGTSSEIRLPNQIKRNQRFFIPNAENIAEKLSAEDGTLKIVGRTDNIFSLFNKNEWEWDATLPLRMQTDIDLTTEQKATKIYHFIKLSDSFYDWVTNTIGATRVFYSIAFYNYAGTSLGTFSTYPTNIRAFTSTNLSGTPDYVKIQIAFEGLEERPSALTIEAICNAWQEIQIYSGKTQITDIANFYYGYDLEDVNGNPIRALVVNLERSTGDWLPSYWQTYMNSKIVNIVDADASIGNHGDSFAFITDVHYPQNYTGNSKYLMRYIKSHSAIRQYVCGGDLIDGSADKELNLGYICNFRDDFVNVNMITIRGNHDGNSNYSNYDANEVITDGDWYGTIVHPIEDLVSPTREIYFYRDNKAQKIRYIFLDTGYPDSHVMSDDQINWMVARINELESGWGVVVFAHQYYANITTIDANGTKIQNALDGIYDTANATIICVISGHIHRDADFVSEKGYPIIITTCDNYAGENASSGLSRSYGNTTEQAFDLFYIDTTARTINTIRIGAGTNRSFTY